MSEIKKESLDEAALKYTYKKGITDILEAYKLSSFDIEELAFKAGAQWQKQQDQSTIELAEDHAYLAGQEKMIDKACEWLKENKDHPFIGCEDPCLSGYLTDEFVKTFEKAMRE